MTLLSSVRSVLVDLYLGRLSPVAEHNLAWNIQPHDTHGLTIRWPRQYQWSAAGDWVDVLKNGFEKYVPIVEVDDIPQRFKGTVVFQVEKEQSRRNLSIVYSDYLDIDADCLQSSDLCFKYQFDRKGYGDAKVLPGGYVPDGKRLYFHLNELRKIRGRQEFKFDVYGRFGLDYAREIREKAVAELSSQDSFRFEGGMKKVSYVEFLREVAGSKVCIDMPGQGDFCFRLVNYLAIGSCIVAYPHRTMLHVPLEDRKHIVYCKPDMSDLVSLCEYYVSHDEEREAIASNARAFFDINLHKDNLTRYYLRTIIDNLA